MTGLMRRDVRVKCSPRKLRRRKMPIIIQPFIEEMKTENIMSSEQTDIDTPSTLAVGFCYVGKKMQVSALQLPYHNSDVGVRVELETARRPVISTRH